MLLAEAVGPEQFRNRVKIYGTDVDEEALNQARLGSYDSRAVEEVPPELLREVLRSCERPTRLQQRAAPESDLRAARSHPGRSHLTGESADVPELSDVLQCRGAGADPLPLPLWVARTWSSRSGQGGNPAHPLDQLWSCRREAADLYQSAGTAGAPSGGFPPSAGRGPDATT